MVFPPSCAIAGLIKLINRININIFVFIFFLFVIIVNSNMPGLVEKEVILQCNFVACFFDSKIRGEIQSKRGETIYLWKI
ncbi:hypothetical protein A2526_02105 [candidate division WOR-1 bacterium RIFOXYD2_FULL_36_8]|uniref:Uncharacterized protein n=1 Tax=candidate division WOR-1 bacterium RIFOXYB2_FULL_36_35 TaxID=1802578 RepID=A0A1F4RZZ2_UNCSA|nr:MAG: hypothetical protein A2230_00165 [candidate division WOR-1 bacterium RIFOXYA2_FULL_36_21]OGC13754.1 MAG: hypothetical protein A2290_07765 [candidate division WOR-1 bacterium RIFOXYB2_FULL_36_35]OGC14477.1 MAG: hypothetical protein A2282_08765 [candidate division WOR-1 bacterium RIFOXYA12_FULL_36_13]OGC41331.1 MAG: hypothetical protein A2526_02105 [candidate division WOR-1 bacterium RIFOXYD2_FULL_36_8]